LPPCHTAGAANAAAAETAALGRLALQRDYGDLSKTEVKTELTLSAQPWTKCVLSDIETLKIQTMKDMETKWTKHEHFKMTGSAYKYTVLGEALSR